jgi:hypothetical protein
VVTEVKTVGPVRVNDESQSSQQVLQLLAMFRMIFDEADGSFALPRGAVCNLLKPAKLPSFRAVLTYCFLETTILITRQRSSTP